MSDTSQGSGWWRASDGLWYPPELFPQDWPGQPLSPEEDQEEAPVDSAVAEVVRDPMDEPLPLGRPRLATDDAERMPVSEVPVMEVPITDPPMPEVPSGWAPPSQSAEPTTVIAAAAALRDSTHLQPVIDPGPTVWAPPGPATAPVSTFPPPTPPQAHQPPPPSPWGATAAPGPPSTWSAPAAPPTAPPVYGTPLAAAPAAWPTSGPFPGGTASTAAPTAGPDIPAGLLLLAGGGALAATSFVDWADISHTSGTVSGSINALNGSNGPGILICAALAVLGALALFAGWRKWWIGAAALVVGLVAGGLWVFSYYDLGDPLTDRLIEDLRQLGREDAIPGIVVERTAALWVVLAGAASTILGGFLALVRRR